MKKSSNCYSLCALCCDNCDFNCVTSEQQFRGVNVPADHQCQHGACSELSQAEISPPPAARPAAPGPRVGNVSVGGWALLGRYRGMGDSSGQHAASRVLNTPSGNGRDIKAGLSHALCFASHIFSWYIFWGCAWWNICTKSIETLLWPGHLQRWPEISAQRQKQKMLRIWIFWLLIAEKLERLFQWSHKNRVQISRYGDMVIFMPGPGQATAGPLQSRYWLVTGDSLIGSSLDN